MPFKTNVSEKVKKKRKKSGRKGKKKPSKTKVDLTSKELKLS